MSQTNTCSRCQARWTAADVCHCNGCHHTFSSLTAFEAHRRANTCRTPHETGLVLLGRTYPCYGRPTKTTAPWLNPAGNNTPGAA
ncbi:FDXHR family putative zinc-binding protein [Rhodococcus sp. SJ-3]|uniref:FDXHR family putative zinc-binding protein n=1 Tax=Rhodococcus sp. SJ-3 TaxID=3454628 RepID=UPI003F7A4A5B